jgi:hypothetical protein
MSKFPWPLVAAMFGLGCSPSVTSTGETGSVDGSSTAFESTGPTGDATTGDISSSAADMSSTSEASSSSSGTTGNVQPECDEPPDGLVLLVCGQVDEDEPIAVDDDWVYFVSADDRIFRASLDGGATEQLFEDVGGVRSMVVDGDRLFWTSHTAVYRGASSGGNAVFLSNAQRPRVAVVGDDAFVSQAGGTFPLLRLDLGTGQSETHYPDQDWADWIFAVGDQLYFMSGEGRGVEQSRLMRGDTLGTPPLQIAEGTASVEGLHAHNVDAQGWLWWVRSTYDPKSVWPTQSLVRTDLDTGTTEEILDAISPRSFAFHEGRIYLAEGGDLVPDRLTVTSSDDLSTPEAVFDVRASSLTPSTRGVVFVSGSSILRVDD